MAKRGKLLSFPQQPTLFPVTCFLPWSLRAVLLHKAMQEQVSVPALVERLLRAQLEREQRS
jgi:hypothetical protein